MIGHLPVSDEGICSSLPKRSGPEIRAISLSKFGG